MACFRPNYIFIEHGLWYDKDALAWKSQKIHFVNHDDKAAMDKIIREMKNGQKAGYDDLANEYYSVPCGKCIGCKSDHSLEWACRIILESSQYDKNCFLTLTYDDINLPSDRLIHKEDVQKFIKRLRKILDPQKIRYFAVGEYGERTHRPHYHLIIFNWCPDDLRYYSSNGLNQSNFTSRVIDKTWSLGRAVVSPFEPATANYVARYTLKKAGCKNEYFQLQSTKPAIGSEVLLNNWEKYYQDDHILGNFGFRHCAPLPRYFLKKLKEISPESYKKLKKKHEKTSDELFDSFNIITHEQSMDNQRYARERDKLEHLKVLKRNKI